MGANAEWHTSGGAVHRHVDTAHHWQGTECNGSHHLKLRYLVWLQKGTLCQLLLLRLLPELLLRLLLGLGNTLAQLLGLLLLRLDGTLNLLLFLQDDGVDDSTDCLIAGLLGDLRQLLATLLLHHMATALLQHLRPSKTLWHCHRAALLLEEYLAWV